jgi:hypothetical protein
MIHLRHSLWAGTKRSGAPGVARGAPRLPRMTLVDLSPAGAFQEKVRPPAGGAGLGQSR